MGPCASLGPIAGDIPGPLIEGLAAPSQLLRSQWANARVDYIITILSNGLGLQAG